MRRLNLAIFALTLLATAITLPALGGAALPLMALWAVAMALLARRCAVPSDPRSDPSEP
jgi:hypothetical protein